ncbi:MAG: hypothetical protein E7527_05210 [Ruminococcaceae bacterium]|nr:hypothetical protein [Oscillospiraceae bacterium]
MFKNVGRTIKKVAKWVFAIQCFVVLVVGFELMRQDDDLAGWGLLLWIVGPLVAWLSSLLLYGFGEIVDTAIINRKPQSEKKEVEKNEYTPRPDVFYPISIDGAESKESIPTEEGSYVDAVCPYCQEPLSFSKETKEALCPNCLHTFDLK